MSDHGEDAATTVQSELRGRIALVRINRPRVLNALDLQTRVLLGQILAQFVEDPDCGAIVISGVGGHFCSGGDISSMADDTTAARERVDEMNQVIRRIARSPKPVIAAVDGVAHGVGLSLACACDLIVCSQSANFRAAFVRMGLGPDGGLSATLPARVGHHARWLLMSAARVDASKARSLGLVDKISTAEQAEDDAITLAECLAVSPPLALGAIKRLSPPLVADLDLALEAEAEAQSVLMASDESIEARRAFLEKRAPVSRRDPAPSVNERDNK